MKGITHFISGIAAATFIPGVVEAAANGSYLLALAGACALLPDTLDFKFWRYFEQPDVSIDPGVDVDPQAVAQQVAGAISTAYETGRPVRVQLHTIRLGADLWRQYSLRFDVEQGSLSVRVGPIVNTSQLPYPGSEPDPPREASVKVGAQHAVPLRYTYDAETKIDIFSGPSFSFERVEDGVAIEFLPWHREWSHSLVVALGLGAVFGLHLGPLAALCAAVGAATHVLEDQLGAMGSNLFWPLARKRTAGLGLLRSGDAIPNFLTVYLACAAILFNMDRYSAAPRLGWPYLVYAVLMPAVVMIAAYAYGRRKRAPEPAEKAQQADIVAEGEEVEA
ncbi:MAG: metal-dependent hydrolase [Thermoflexales bacterium]|nr:metal-dependent hydrolase [Thermoflexales bacterium]